MPDTSKFVGSANDMAPPSRTAEFSTKDIVPRKVTFGLKEEHRPPEKHGFGDGVDNCPSNHLVVGVQVLFIPFIVQRLFAQLQRPVLVMLTIELRCVLSDIN